MNKSEFIPYNKKKNKKKSPEFKVSTKVTKTESDSSLFEKRFWYMPKYNESGDIIYEPNFSINERYK